MENKLKGIIIPAVTVFDEEGNVDIKRMERNYNKWMNTDIAGLMILGTNGEFRQLSDKESLQVVKTAAACKKGKTLIVGAGRESLRLTLDFMESLNPYWESIDYLSVMTPNFFAKHMTDQALYGYYHELADYSPVPLLLYMAPAYANGVKISVDLAAALADHPNIAGIKDTSTDQMNSLMVRLGKRQDFSVLAGSLNNLMTCLSWGGLGGVVSAGNYFPQECATLTRLFFEGDVTAAYNTYSELQILAQKTGGSKGISSLKACMDILGYEGGAPRLPVLPLAEEEINIMRNHLQKAGKL